MKDEYQVRVEALRLAIQSGVVPSVRITEAAKYEQYILNGHSGEAPLVPPPADKAEVPATGGKAPPGNRTKRDSSVPAAAGEASDKPLDQEPQAPKGRPSSRVAGFAA